MDGEFIIRDKSNDNATVPDIKEIFEEKARTLGGYEKASCAIMEFDDLKVKWARSADWILLEVSDYLVGVPIRIVEDIATTLMMKLSMMPDAKTEYAEDSLRYLSGAEFSKEHQQTFIKRRGVKIGLVTELRKVVKDCTKTGSDVPENVYAGYVNGNKVLVSRTMRVIMLPSCARKLAPETRAFIIERGLKDIASGLDDVNESSVTWNYVHMEKICAEDKETVARICGGNEHWFFME